MTIQEWLGTDNKIGNDIWHNKYQRKDETFDDWVLRISGGNQKLMNLIYKKQFLFGGRILSNRGITGEKVTYSNCYVITPPEDSIESIYESRKLLARTYSFGGGCGLDISKLSPRGARVRNQAKQTSGAVSFMEGYSSTTEEIGQNGRRGALMISISCEHPDLEEFINIKTNANSVTKANISVRVTDDFMEAVKNNTDWTLFYERAETGERIEKIVKAQKIFEMLCTNNWNWAEPGILYWDTIEKRNLLSNNPDFKYAGVNPCAEEPLPAGGSCLLGSLALCNFINNGKFNFAEFAEAVEIAVDALDEVLDEGLPLHPLQEQRDSVADWRQIGLGVMGIADMLIELGIPYGSKESIALCDALAKTMIEHAIKQSALLAKEYGAYPKYDKRVLESDFFVSNVTDQSIIDLVKEYGLRHSQLLTIAPTGSISTMLGISGGIEPIFANSYTRKTESLHGHDEYYKIYTPIVQKYMNEHEIKNEEDLPEFFQTSSTISAQNRIKMQAIWQSHIDASISSTVNLPESATIQNVMDIYMSAWEAGLKGITIFRDGSKKAGILTSGPAKESQDDNELTRGKWKQKADDTVYYQRKLKIGCGKLSLFIGWSNTEKAIQDFYIQRTGTGGCEKSVQSTTIAMSGMLRLGGDIFNIEKAFEGLGPCNSFTAARAKGQELSPGHSCGSAILNELKKFLKEQGVEIKSEEKPKPPSKVNDRYYPCPECGEKTLAFEGGCNTCSNCGFSKCN